MVDSFSNCGARIRSVPAREITRNHSRLTLVCLGQGRASAFSPKAERRKTALSAWKPTAALRISRTARPHRLFPSESKRCFGSRSASFSCADALFQSLSDSRSLQENFSRKSVPRLFPKSKPQQTASLTRFGSSREKDAPCQTRDAFFNQWVIWRLYTDVRRCCVLH